MKIIPQKRGGGFQRLVVMTENEYANIKNSVPAEKSVADNDGSDHSAQQMVEQYLGPDSLRGVPAEHRLTMYNQALARASASKQFTSRNPVSTEQPRNKGKTAEEVEELQEEIGVAEERPREEIVVLDEESTLPRSVPEVTLPRQYASRVAALKKTIEASGSVRVDEQDRVWLSGELLHDTTKYGELLRSLFVKSRLGDSIPGRVRFLEHLAKIGVVPSDVSAQSAKDVLKASKVEQLGGRKRASSKTKYAFAPPGKRPRPLFMYR
jgi:hypothetical protein